MKPTPRTPSLCALTFCLLASACEPLTLDGFLYDPLPAPPEGYRLSTAIIPAHEDHFVTTADGERIHVAFVPPTNPNPTLPALIYFHGQSTNIGTAWPRIEALYPLGLAIYAVDPRGYGRSTGTPSEAGIVADLEAVSRWLANERGLRDSRLVYYGRSLGGAFAIHLATIAAPAVLITESTFTSIAAMVEDGAYAPLPASFVVKSRWDSLAKVATITSPYLNLHGTADPYVQYKYAEQLVAAHQGKDQLEAVPGADHGDVPQRLGLSRYREIIAKFLSP